MKPGFIGGGDDNAIYIYSMICLENAHDIMEVLRKNTSAFMKSA